MSDYTSRYGDALARNKPKSLQSPVSKSWLFEIVDRETGVIDESFTLILPPQSYTIKEAQRIAITKTFGNAFVDDYGPDNIEITLKGISGTVHVFPTFTTSGKSAEFTDVSLVTQDIQNKPPGSGFDGRDAFYAFRNRIMRYKDKGGWEKRELRVYDLADEQAYKCVLLDFTLERTSEQPLHYPFTISLFVYQRLEKYRPKLREISISEDPILMLNKIDEAMDSVTVRNRGIPDVVNSAAMLKARALELRHRWNRELTRVSRVLTSPLDMAKNFVDAAFALVGIAYDTYRAGKYTFERYMSLSEFARDTLNNGLRIYGYQISEGWQRTQTTSYERDEGVVPEDGVGVDSASRSFETVSYSFSGLDLYTVQGQDTLSSIALKELGDEELWPFIADVNEGINSSGDLVSGESIFIPVQADLVDVPKERFIFSENPSRDPYGTDILLSSTGDLMFQDNDFVLVSGVSNVQQAVDLRLNTDVGSLIKQSGYGITAQAGFAGSSMAIRYLKMAIRSTLMQDPRIESVDNMIVSLGGDALHVSMTLSVVGYEKSIPVPLNF